jgi:hypothetical protein
MRFLTGPNAPFTNNEAERDLCMGKVRQKVGCIGIIKGALGGFVKPYGCLIALF